MFQEGFVQAKSLFSMSLGVSNNLGCRIVISPIDFNIESHCSPPKLIDIMNLIEKGQHECVMQASSLFSVSLEVSATLGGEL